MKSTTQLIVIAGLVAGAFAVGYVLTNPANCIAFCSPVVQTISTEEFKNRIESKSYKLVDVRTPQEFAEGHIANATNADFENSAKFNEYLNTLNKNEKYLIYCRSGNRSGKALEIMKRKGFSNVSDLSGGIVSWQKAGNQLVNN